MLVISKSFKFRLTPSSSQKEIFSKWAGTCRFIYNLALEHRIVNWQQFRKGENYYSQANELKNIKKCEGFEWIKEVPHHCLQQTLKDLDRAYCNFWKFGTGYPQFKKRGQKDSFRFPDPKQFSVRRVSKSKAIVKLPKIGEIGLRLSQPIVGKIRNCTIIRQGEHWDISFNCEIEKGIVQITSGEVGIDRGIIKSLAVSNGEFLNIPKKDIIKLENKIARLQRSMRKKNKFSANWMKAKLKIGKIHRRITHIRKNSLHQFSTEIAKNHGLVCLENLKVKNMTASAKGTIKEPGKNVKAKSGLNKSILREGWSIFQNMLEYKCQWFGSKLVLVPPHFTSQDCPKCEHRNEENRIDEKFECKNCGYKNHADTVGAINVLVRGRRMLDCGGKGPRLSCEAGTSYGESVKESPTKITLVI